MRYNFWNYLEAIVSRIRFNKTEALFIYRALLTTIFEVDGYFVDYWYLNLRPAGVFLSEHD